MGTGLKPNFIKGMGKRDDKFFIIIPDMDQVFSEKELTDIGSGMEAPDGEPEASQSRG